MVNVKVFLWTILNRSLNMNFIISVTCEVSRFLALLNEWQVEIIFKFILTKIFLRLLRRDTFHLVHSLYWKRMCLFQWAGRNHQVGLLLRKHMYYLCFSSLIRTHPDWKNPLYFICIYSTVPAPSGVPMFHSPVY